MPVTSEKANIAMPLKGLDQDLARSYENFPQNSEPNPDFAMPDFSSWHNSASAVYV